MQVQPVQEAIDVVAAFSGGRCRPVRFTWARRELDVDQLNAHWVDRSGRHDTLNYSVQSGEETYYLRFDCHEVRWWLETIITE